MSQSVWSSINPATTSGTQLATLLNDFKDAVMSGLSGTSRPTQTTAGGAWIDTSNEAPIDGEYWSYMIYDGTTDIEVFRVNLATGAASISGADGTFQVLKVSADTAGPIYKAIKQRIANSGQVLSGDTVGEFQFVGRGDDSSNPIAARIRAVATNNMGATAAGAYVVVEAITTGTTTLSEVARFIDGKMGIGITAPTVTLHVRSTTGMKSERYADDSSGALFTFRKRRISGTGATQNGDILARCDFASTDDATAEAVTGRIEVLATQAHTSSNQGTQFDFKACLSGGNTLTSLFTLDGAKAEFKTNLVILGYKLQSQDIATSATISALNADKALVNFTGSTATTLQGISASGVTNTILLHNGSSANVTLAHENGSATAANRMKLPSSRNITLKPDSSIELFYHAGDSRWKIKSGAGSGGETVPYGSIASPRTVAAAVGITSGASHMDTGVDSQTIIAQGPSTGTTAVTANPQIEAGTSIGQKMTIIGGSDTDVFTLSDGNGLSLKGDWASNLRNVIRLEFDGVLWTEVSRNT